MRINNSIVIVLLCFIVGNTAYAQKNKLDADTVRMNLDSAESIFLRNNYLLLAQKYNIDVNQALEIQAKLYPNPNISVTTTLSYSVNGKTTFFPLPFTSNGEISGGISQEIVIAGKINKAVKLAQANTKLSVYQFYDLIRTLKYTLRSDFYNIYYMQQSMKVYKEEIDGLQTVVNAYKKQEEEGKHYISEKDVVRMKAQLYSLESEYQSLVDQVNDTESELKLLIQVKTKDYIEPLVDSAMVTTADPLKFPLTVLLDSAYSGRTDLQIAKTTTEISRLNYVYQKALAVPDPSVGWSYDQQGAFNNNFMGIGVSIDLPFFNRNQGNIKSAKATIKMNEASEKSTFLTVEENVYRSVQRAIDAEKLFKKVDPSFGSDYDRLVKAALENFKTRNMNILDFLDFYDSYKQNTLQINGIKYNKLNALEQINFYTGTNFFN